MTETGLALIEQVVIQGDLAKLSSQQRVTYYREVCESVGLNPLTKPFQYITLNGRLVLYATKDCTDQLRKRDGIAVVIQSTERVDDLYVVRARASTPDGRSDEEVGAVSVAGLRGEALANAMMKATTKAKRRVTLSICGLGMTDETETETIPGAVKVEVDTETGEIVAAPEALPAPRGNDVDVERGITALVEELVRAGVSPGRIPDSREHRARWLETATERWAQNPKNPRNAAPAPVEGLL